MTCITSQTVAMLLAIVVSYLSVIVAANPFHKYPFAFLLDVGNEELQKTKSEQLRVSVPGGSVALRYPAIGDGNIISHVRVSGIDFGTDLKANIVDGGPGYKYVVLVFMGNPGVPFDAVVTVKTIEDSGYNVQDVGTIVNSDINAYQSEEDANNSAEDLSDAEVTNNLQSETVPQNTNAELMQSSSNVYRYVNNEQIYDSDDDNDGPDEGSDDADEDNDGPSNEAYSNELFNGDSEGNDEFESANDEKDIHNVQYTDDINEGYDPSQQVKGIEEDNDANDNDGTGSNEEEYLNNDSSNPVIVDNNLYSKYAAVKDHFNNGGNVYSQEEYQKNSRPVYQEDPLDYEDPDGVVPNYDEEEINNGRDKFRDSNNNNYIDSDDSYAVAY